MYHEFYSPPLFRTAVSGGALWVQRDSPDFRAHTHLWARTNLCLSRSSPLCKMLMCTNKTCFAGVGTRPKTIFRIRISFLLYPCESKKIQIFLSADQTSIPGVNQVFPVLEWNLIFVLLSKILDCLKRLFVVQIPRVTVYREMRNIYV